jgi:hypothetical protein
MVRGWGAAVRTMEAAQEPDNAYVVGLDTNTGTRVAIAYNKVVQVRFQFLHGPRAIVRTPDEVATLVAAQGMMLAIKAAFPGAEIVGLERAALPARISASPCRTHDSLSIKQGQDGGGWNAWKRCGRADQTIRLWPSVNEPLTGADL